MKVRAPFCPGVPSDTVLLAPVAITSVVSAGTSQAARFMLPWYVSGGSSTIEYVPLTGSVTGSTNTPLMPTVFGP